MKIFILLLIILALILLIIRKNEFFQDSSIFKMDNISIKGKDGLRGIPGPRGPTGPRGPRGPPGTTSPNFNSINIGSFTISEQGGRLIIKKRGVASGFKIGVHNPKGVYGHGRNGLHLAPTIPNTGSIGTHKYEFDDVFIHGYGRRRGTTSWLYD